MSLDEYSIDILHSNQYWMKFLNKKLLKTKLFLTIIVIVYILYIGRDQLFFSYSCKHLYNSNSFARCASLNKTCNIRILLNSYLNYRSCVLQRSSNDIDYVVFDAVNGLGNRILGLIAVTTYALVTSRVLLINWQPGDNHQAYFEDLFLPLSLSDKIPFYHQYSLSRLTNLLENRWINEIEWQTKASHNPRDWAFYFDQRILCNSEYYNQTWIQRWGFSILNFLGDHRKWIRTDQYFVPILTRNEKIRQVFLALFQHGQIFAELSRRFLNPVQKVNLIIENFQTRNNLTNQSLTIGVHMRSWSSNLINYIEPFEKCIDHVIQNISRLRRDENRIYLYVISNTPERRQRLANRISEKYKNLEILHPPETPTIANGVEQMQYTLAELLILSKMQHLIITSKSTFGMAAQGFARKGAWIVRQGASNELKNIKSDLCQWESTSEPEYQMIRSLQINDSCSQHDVSLLSVGERTII